MNALKGRVWKFDHDVTTDSLMPNATLYGKVPDAERKLYCLNVLRPEFAKTVQPGDILVAGRNFGCGSVRPAARNLFELGIAGLLAESFAGTFFRNSINTGLPAIECKGVHSAFDDGDVCTVDLTKGVIENVTKSRRMTFSPFPPEFLNIFTAGGLIALLKKEQAGVR